MPKAVVLDLVGEISWREIAPGDVYQPTPQEEIDHGTKVLARQSGEPGEGEIEVEAVLGAVCTHEVSLYLGDLTHPRYPMIPGHEAVHRVTRVGRGVRHLKAGDYASCCWYMGQWSRKLIGPACFAWKLPDHLSDPALWVIEPAASIVNAAGLMEVKTGSRVLLIGAGFMGLLMTQLVGRYPLARFVAMDIKATNVELARRCGALEAFNPDSDAGKARMAELGAASFDTVIECTGSQRGLDMAVHFCALAGDIALFGWHRGTRSIDLKLGHLRGFRLLNVSPAMDTGRVYERHWPTTIALFEQGVFNLEPLITHRYPATDVARAFEDSVRREEGFVKSVLYLEDWRQ